MEYTVAKCLFVVLAAIILCFDVSLCVIPSNVDNIKLQNQIDGARQSKGKFSSPMWFGPRLGRKKRTEKIGDTRIADILESLDEYPWTVIAINENNNDIEKRGTTHNFTPRLGRTLEENQENMDISERSPPFSPRLGRSSAFSPYSPRLGRDESY